MGDFDTRHPKDIELDMLRRLYNAFSFSIRKYGDVPDPYVLEVAQDYEAQFVERGQRIFPHFDHSVKCG